jgi:hypothetical protein
MAAPFEMSAEMVANTFRNADEHHRRPRHATPSQPQT